MNIFKDGYYTNNGSINLTYGNMYFQTYECENMDEITCNPLIENSDKNMYQTLADMWNGFINDSTIYKSPIMLT